MKTELSWSWHSEGSRRRDVVEKQKWWKSNNIFFGQKNAEVNIVAVIVVVKWKYVIFQDPGAVNVMGKLILILTRKIMFFV